MEWSCAANVSIVLPSSAAASAAGGDEFDATNTAANAAKINPS
jgi:hypothetical protein